VLLNHVKMQKNCKSHKSQEGKGINNKVVTSSPVSFDRLIQLKI
jgi:hypothetical protein